MTVVAAGQLLEANCLAANIMSLPLCSMSPFLRPSPGSARIVGLRAKPLIKVARLTIAGPHVSWADPLRRRPRVVASLSSILAAC
jgi:non-ribosomal peptide synthetase component F